MLHAFCALLHVHVSLVGVTPPWCGALILTGLIEYLAGLSVPSLKRQPAHGLSEIEVLARFFQIRGGKRYLAAATRCRVIEGKDGVPSENSSHGPLSFTYRVFSLDTWRSAEVTSLIQPIKTGRKLKCAETTATGFCLGLNAGTIQRFQHFSLAFSRFDSVFLFVNFDLYFGS